MIFSLLDGEASTSANSQNAWVSWVLIGVLVVLLIGSMFLMNRRNKKREKEAQDRIDAVKPGNKVTTIGGVSGIVVEVNPEDNTFVLETGSEACGKCYMKFIRQAIYETDAVAEKAEDNKAAEPETAEVAPTEEVVADEPVVPVEEVQAEAVAEEKTEE